MRGQTPGELPGVSVRELSDSGQYAPRAGAMSNWRREKRLIESTQ